MYVQLFVNKQELAGLTGTLEMMGLLEHSAAARVDVGTGGAGPGPRAGEGPSAGEGS